MSRRPHRSGGRAGDLRPTRTKAVDPNTNGATNGAANEGILRLEVPVVIEAIARRAHFQTPPFTNVRRLVDGVGDGLPGFVVDRYDDVVRIELWAERWPGTFLDVVDALRTELPLRGVPLRGVVALLRTGAGRSELSIPFGTVPEAQVVQEAGARYLVRVADAKAVGSGIFVDQREGRRLVREAAAGRTVLNLFAHAGAFGVAAAVGGAAAVDHCDMARKCATWAAANLALNGFDPRKHRYLVDDALQILQKAARRQAGYGVIVCDPPTQGTRRDGTHFVLRNALAELAEDGCRALGDGGLLILSCNDRDVAVDDVLAAATVGAQAAGRAVKSVEALPVPADITSKQAPRGRPMRGAVVQLR